MEAPKHDHAQIAMVMVPFPAQGHLNQLLHLSHLLTSSEIVVHYVGSTIHNRQAKLRLNGRDTEMMTSSTRVHFHDFKLPPFTSPPPNPDGATHFPSHRQPAFDASMRLRQPVFQLVQELATRFRRVVVVHDFLMSSVVQDVKHIANAETYVFIPISAFTVFYEIWEAIREKPFQLDPMIEIPSIEGCYTPEFAKLRLNQHKFLDFQAGRIYTKSRLIEGQYVNILAKLSRNDDLKHFAIGPFNPIQMKHTLSEKCEHECLEWLDKQEVRSVIYISFGSTTSMSDEQVRELALGLERSEQRFIWVLRDADKGDVFPRDHDHEPRRPRLPEVYEERVRARGLVVRDWAPQLDILAHPSTGGFMSHCGWNSCLESISMGVPIIAWPMHSDQPKNSALVSEVLKTGMVVREWENRAKLVTSTTIANTVKSLMVSIEGSEMRKRAAELSDKIRGSFSTGGTSHLEMESFIAHITR